jgi:hypothetical protein
MPLEQAYRDSDELLKPYKRVVMNPADEHKISRKALWVKLEF